MPSEHSVFEGEWWSPQWPLSSVPLPPDPQKQDLFVLQAFEADLELGAKVPLKRPKPQPFGRGHVRGEETLLMTYPDRLLVATEEAANSENSFQGRFTDLLFQTASTL
jgi:hypothetical protein